MSILNYSQQPFVQTHMRSPSVALQRFCTKSNQYVHLRFSQNLWWADVFSAKLIFICLQIFLAETTSVLDRDNTATMRRRTAASSMAAEEMSNSVKRDQGLEMHSISRFLCSRESIKIFRTKCFAIFTEVAVSCLLVQATLGNFWAQVWPSLGSYKHRH